MPHGRHLSLLTVLVSIAAVYSRGGAGGGGRGGGGGGGGRGSSSSGGSRGGYYAYSGTGYHGDTSAVRSTSAFSGGYFATVNVWYFRGGGSDRKSGEPLVNSSSIYESLFHRDAFSSVFSPWTGEEPVFEHQINPWNFSRSSHEFLKIPLKVVDTSRPMTIANSSLSYFWSNSSLPMSNDSSDCFYYTAINDGRNFTICDVPAMDRCSANISDLPHFSPFTFFSLKGERLSQFSWMCQRGQVCCAWECCDPVNRTTFLYILAILLLIILFSTAAACIYVAVKKQREAKRFEGGTAPIRFRSFSETDPRVESHWARY